MILDPEELAAVQAAVRRWVDGMGYIATDAQCAQCAHAVSEAAWAWNDAKEAASSKKKSKDPDHPPALKP